MQQLYKGIYLSVSFDKENNLFIQNWLQSPDSIEVFKKEMLLYVSLYKKYKPTKSLWLQQKFNLQLNEKNSLWIEEKINVPCKTFGNKKLAFVVSKDILAHIKVIDVFEETNSILKNTTKHFSSKKKALNWLNETTNVLYKKENPQILFEGLDNDGNAIIKIKETQLDFKNILYSFKNLKNRKQHLESSKILVLKNKEVIFIKNIIYIKSDGHYIEYHLDNQRLPILERNSLARVLQVLPKTSFVKIHRSYVVHVTFIKVLHSTKLQLQNNSWLPISRTYKEHIINSIS